MNKFQGSVSGSVEFVIRLNIIGLQYLAFCSKRRRKKKQFQLKICFDVCMVLEIANLIQFGTDFFYSSQFLKCQRNWLHERYLTILYFFVNFAFTYSNNSSYYHHSSVTKINFLKLSFFTKNINIKMEEKSFIICMSFLLQTSQ